MKSAKGEWPSYRTFEEPKREREKKTEYKQKENHELRAEDQKNFKNINKKKERKREIQMVNSET